MKIKYILFYALIIIFSCKTGDTEDKSTKNEDSLIASPDIRVRDPFILADDKTQTYYLYASINNRTQDESEGQGVEVYKSKDLQHWTTPKSVFNVPDEFWATKWVWAPEVHQYKDEYYLFTTFTSYDTITNPPTKPSDNWPPFYKRGSQILKSDSPEGPFIPFGNKPHTSIDRMTLDGTLWVENNLPYMIYCHEWVEIKDGTMNLVQLNDGLSAVHGDDKVLFKASDAPWARAVADGIGYVTDGCFLYRTKTNKLLMIWSSFGEDGYSIGLVESESGSIKGPWRHLPDRLFEKDGGHGMIFKTFDGQLVVALHQPNNSPNERMQLYKIKDTGESLKLDGRLY